MNNNIRFYRDYELLIGNVTKGKTQDTEQLLTIKPDIRINFSCDKAVQGGLNKMTVKVYNLIENKRLMFYKRKEDSSKYIPIQLSVGYKNHKEIIFKGDIQRGVVAKQGTDYINTFDCLDGGYDYINSFVSLAITGKENVINELLKSMKNTNKGTVTKSIGLIKRPKVLLGNALDLLKASLPKDIHCYIDNEQLFIVKKQQDKTANTSEFIPIVSNDTGLLGTPELQFAKISFVTVINPALKLNGKVQVISAVNPNLNGIYTIQSMAYTGDNWGTDWKQSVTGFFSLTNYFDDYYVQ